MTKIILVQVQELDPLPKTGVQCRGYFRHPHPMVIQISWIWGPLICHQICLKDYFINILQGKDTKLRSWCGGKNGLKCNSFNCFFATLVYDIQVWYKIGVCVKSITSDFWTREEGARLKIVVSYFLFSSCFPLMRETDSKNSQVHLVPA